MNRKTLKKLYHKYINLDQFFSYGSARLQILWYFLSLMSNIGILIIYLKLPQNPFMLIGFAIIVCITVMILGFSLFRVKAQQADIIMQGWRNPLNTLMSIVLIYGHSGVYEKLGLEFPEALKKWGVEDWDDLRRMADYILAKGEEAYALTICQKLLEGQKK